MSGSDPTRDMLYEDPGLAGFYDLENGWGPDQDYCLGLASGARSVLDLGCGTGRLAVALAPGREVAGIDPAAAMLAIARQRPGGGNLDWIRADARDVRLGRRFDLVVLTGHAFQVFLTAQDQRAVLGTIAAHLVPDGRFVFDTRNPAVEEWRTWTPELSRRGVDHPELGPVEAWNDVAFDAASGIVTYETHYRIAGTAETRSASSQILFTGREELAALLDDAGLAVDTWLGDWHGAAWTPSSPEIIPVGRLR